MPEGPVYLDCAATTPLDPRVAEAMARCMVAADGFANPSSQHAPGRAARRRVDEARADVAALIGAVPEAIFFTSGATEGDNLAVLGAARGNRDRGRHIVTSRTEHRAVLDACTQLEAEGFQITRLAPGPDGRVAPAQVEAALRPDSILVSLMHANNETGVVQDIAAVGKLCRARGVLLHVDAAQSVGKLPVDVEALGADLLSFTAHKLHGPKGIGALWVRRQPRPTLQPLQFGGGQEGRLRPGTLAVHQIVGFGLACRLARESLALEATRQAALREQLWQRLAALGGVYPNAAAEPRLPGLLNLGFLGIEGESLLLAIDAEVAASSGSACNSAAAEPSYVLRALGLGDVAAQASLRLSLGRLTAAPELERAAEAIARAVRRLRWLAPPAALAAFPRPAATIGEVLREAAGPHLVAPAAAGPESSGAYSARVLELFRELPCAGDLPAGPGEAWAGEAGDLATGAWIRFELRVQQGLISAAAFRAWGCPHVVAAAAAVALRLPGVATAQAAGMAAPRALAAELAVPPAKLGRLLRVEDALQALRPARID